MYVVKFFCIKRILLATAFDLVFIAVSLGSVEWHIDLSIVNWIYISKLGFQRESLCVRESSFALLLEMGGENLAEFYWSEDQTK